MSTRTPPAAGGPAEVRRTPAEVDAGWLTSVLDANGLVALEFEPGSTPTAKLAAARIGVELSRIAKSLLFKGKDGAYYMVVCPGDRRLPPSALKRATLTKLSMTDAEETERDAGQRVDGGE